MELNHKHRYPWPVIETAILFYVKEKLTYREVSENMKKIGVNISYKTIGEWIKKFRNHVNYKNRMEGILYFIEESFVKCNGENLVMYQALNDKKQIYGIFLREKRNIMVAKKHFLKTIDLIKMEMK